MSPLRTIDDVAKAMAEAVIAVCGERLGGEASAAPAETPATPGWTLTVPVSGSTTGRIAVWFDRTSAAACARAALRKDEMPGDDAVVGVLVEWCRAAATAVTARADGAGLEFGAPIVGQGTIGAGAQVSYVAVANAASCLLAVGVDRAGALRPDISRLGAVMEVDLPLVVRFGRTVMPLRDIADLGPGSVVDLGRSPEEPVDVLIGERVIARGDVVVVGGNYGVRITQLAGNADFTVDKEAQTS